jgi:hypothetical protein
VTVSVGGRDREFIRGGTVRVTATVGTVTVKGSVEGGTSGIKTAAVFPAPDCHCPTLSLFRRPRRLSLSRPVTSKVVSRWGD